MTRPHWLLFSALVALTCVLGNAEDVSKAQPPSDVAELQGKIVAMTLVSDVEDLVLISNISEKQIGKRSFLTGTGVDDGETPDWRNGATVYIPVDDIQQLIAFDNLKAYQKNLNSRLERSEGKAASATRRTGRTIAQRRTPDMTSER